MKSIKHADTAINIWHTAVKKNMLLSKCKPDSFQTLNSCKTSICLCNFIYFSFTSRDFEAFYRFIGFVLRGSEEQSVHLEAKFKLIPSRLWYAIRKKVCEWSTAEAGGVCSSLPLLLLPQSLLWFLTPTQERSEPSCQSKRGRQIGGDPWRLIFFFSFFKAVSVSLLSSQASLTANIDVSGKVIASEQLEANLLMSVMTSELPLQRYSQRVERRVWCFDAHVFYQPASQATARPHPSPLRRGLR